MNQNRMAVLAGGFVAALSTAVLFFLPVLIPVSDVKVLVFSVTGTWLSGNPFSQLLIFGGIPGALVGGYLAEDEFGTTGWETSMKIGAYATLFSLVLIWTAYVVYTTYNTLFVQGVFPPPIYLITVIPLIYMIPLFPSYLLEGVIFGVIGGVVNTSHANEGGT